MSTTVSLGFATFFAIVSLVLLAFAFGTDRWISTQIDWKSPVTEGDNFVKNLAGRVYFQRYNGLFRECFHRRNTSIHRNPALYKNLVDGNCIMVQYQIPEQSGSRYYSDDYWAMIHLKRCVVAFLIVAMVFLLSAAIFGAISCWRTTNRSANMAGIFAFIAAFFAAMAMAFFHGAEYIEKHKLSMKDPGFYYKNWDRAIQEASVRRYSWSYVIGWVGVGVAILSAILYVFTAWYIKDKKREDQLYEQYSTMRRPPTGYDYVLEPQPVYSLRQPPLDDYVYYGKQPPPQEVYIDQYGNKVEPTWEYRY